MKKLNLGCGDVIKPGYVNLDIAKLEGVDVVHDLNRFPYPFKAGTFDEVLADAILEHVDDFIAVMRELHRICKPGAIIRAGVPYWNSTLLWADPTHKRGFTFDTFTYFEQHAWRDRSYYFDFHFKVRKQRLTGTAVGRFLPEFLRRKLAFFLCNIGESINVELEVVK